jgi:hypothetical protein
MSYYDPVIVNIFGRYLGPHVYKLTIGWSALANYSTVPPSIVMLHWKLVTHSLSDNIAPEVAYHIQNNIGVYG